MTTDNELASPPLVVNDSGVYLPVCAVHSALTKPLAFASPVCSQTLTV